MVEGAGRFVLALEMLRGTERVRGIALDLLDSPEPRARQVGDEVLREIERA